MEASLSYEAEEYIEAIYRLQKRSGAAKTKELAEELQVVPGSITNTIEHLEKHSLVEHEPYRGVKLTMKGQKLALDIVRRHRLAERLLTDILNVEWINVHESACRLEHALTKDVVPLLEKRLGHPKFCPHGNPIPTEEGEMKEEECLPLIDMDLDEEGRVAKITDEKKEKLLHLAGKGIRLDAPVHVAKRLRSSMILCVSGRECTLSYDAASDVWVKILRRKANAIQK
ncbi:MAG: metal-dependent transcriptional regulator [Candidatus Bathyarchaeota archaeon]|nr:metal-dependent transcriptional regulator [Candidatus Bathyarchaeota archaeon]MDH5787962.1 metal-dependent transcriptional regulator [Candidatus Bathyarchaeota archaeon]